MNVIVIIVLITVVLPFPYNGVLEYPMLVELRAGELFLRRNNGQLCEH